MYFHRKNLQGFTLFELIISITIFSIIMISVFDSVANIGIARITTTQKVSLLEELYFFSEKLTTTIKEGGTIDYEEYWARSVIGTGSTNGHYMTGTLFGNYGSGAVVSTGATNNFGSGLYYCRSGNASFMGTGGCLSHHNNDAGGVDYSGKFQRYGEYRLQFTDYNGNKDSDTGEDGDEDGTGGITNDDDDIELGDGPSVISNPVLELYLINALKKERTFFRIHYSVDPDRPPGAPCNTVTGVGIGCVGSVQILKMKGLDLGMRHNGTGSSSTDNTVFDGNIDTWICQSDWRCSGKVLPGGYGTISFNDDDDWIDIFPDYINAKSLRFHVYPLKNPWYSWKAPDDLSSSSFITPFIQPYVRMELTLGFAWKRRSIIRNDDPTITVSTTINLQDYANE